jgi:hypothetical protein
MARCTEDLTLDLAPAEMLRSLVNHINLTEDRLVDLLLLEHDLRLRSRSACSNVLQFLPHQRSALVAPAARISARALTKLDSRFVSAEFHKFSFFTTIKQSYNFISC